MVFVLIRYTCKWGTVIMRDGKEFFLYFDNFIHLSMHNMPVQALISVQALVFDLAQLTCQKRFDCRNAILGSSAILLSTSYS